MGLLLGKSGALPMAGLIRSVNVPLRGCGVCDVSGHHTLSVCCAMMGLGLGFRGGFTIYRVFSHPDLI